MTNQARADRVAGKHEEKTMLRISLLAGAMLIAAPAFAQTPSASAAPAAGATAPASATPATAATAAASATPTAGATVYDPQGGTVGTVASISGSTATIDTGKNKVGLPFSSFAAGDKGPVIAMTRDQVDQAAAGAKANAAAAVTAGASVKGPKGEPVGTIKSVDGQYAVLDTGAKQAKLLLSAFASTDGGLVIGLTKAQVEAAAGAAAPK